jgi:hypothetical protein
VKKVTSSLALLSLVACGDRGCSCGSTATLDPTQASADAAPVTSARTDASDSIESDAAHAPSENPKSTVAFKGKPQGAGFTPSGHVLFATGNGHVLDWNLNGDLRDVDLGNTDAKNAVQRIHLASGASAFIVERGVKDQPTHVELWDADTVKKLRDLEGTFERTQTFAYSRDRSKLMFGRCMMQPDPPSALQCDGAVYALPSGDLVHRSTFTPMAVQGYVPTMALSPTGRFVSAESQLAPTELRDSMTGNLVLTVIDHSWGPMDEGNVKLVWLDDTHVLHTTHQGGWLTVTHMVPRPEVKNPPITLKVTRTKEESLGDPRLSPDRHLVATVAKLEGGAELVVWDTTANESHRHPVARDICVDDCQVDWLDREWIMVSSRAAKATTSFEVNANTKEEKIAPKRAVPTYTSGGFSVLSTLVASSTENVAYAHARDGVAPTPLVVVTPSGARVDLGVAPERASIAVQGDHILISTLKATDVISAKGEWARFTND